MHAHPHPHPHPHTHTHTVTHRPSPLRHTPQQPAVVGVYLFQRDIHSLIYEAAATEGPKYLWARWDVVEDICFSECEVREARRDAGEGRREGGKEAGREGKSRKNARVWRWEGGREERMEGGKEGGKVGRRERSKERREVTRFRRKKGREGREKWER